MLICGAWSKFRVVDEEKDVDILKIFEDATNMMVGSSFETPLIVAQQVVNGVNYKFICNAMMSTNPAVSYTAEVLVYKPPQADPVLVHVRDIDRY